GNVDNPFFTTFLSVGYTAQGSFVIGDEEIFPEEEIEFAGGKDAIFAAVIDGVDGHEEIGSEFVVGSGNVFLDIGELADSNAVFNGKGVEMKDVFQNGLGFFRGRFFKINPEKKIGVGKQCGHEEHLNVLGMQTALSGEGVRPDHRFPAAKDKQGQGALAN